METAAAKALANAVDSGDLREDYITPPPFDLTVGPKVAAAVAVAAVQSKATALDITYQEELKQAEKVIGSKKSGKNNDHS